MPLWDSFADQLHLLPVAGAIDPVNDRLVYAGATRAGAQAAALTNVPVSLVWSVSASGPNTNPTASTTRKDGFQSPYAMTLLRLHLTSTSAYGAGTRPWFDLYNETDSLSPLDNTSAVGQAISFNTTAATIFTDDPIDVPSLPVNKFVGFYCQTASTTNLGSTWGHLQYVI